MWVFTQNITFMQRSTLCGPPVYTPSVYTPVQINAFCEQWLVCPGCRYSDVRVIAGTTQKETSCCECTVNVTLFVMCPITAMLSVLG